MFNEPSRPEVPPAHAMPPGIGAPRKRMVALAVLLTVYALVDLALLSTHVVMLGIISNIRSGGEFGGSAAALFDAISLALAVSSTVLYLSIVPVFCCWFFRIVANARALAGGTGFNPGWAVGSFFVPFVNLVEPCRAMVFAWRGSASSAGSAGEGAWLVGLWWGAWLISNFIGNIALRLTLPGLLGQDQTLDDLKVSTIASLALQASGLACDGLTIVLVLRLTALQRGALGR